MGWAGERGDLLKPAGAASSHPLHFHCWTDSPQPCQHLCDPTGTVVGPSERQVGEREDECPNPSLREVRVTAAEQQDG